MTIRAQKRLLTMGKRDRERTRAFHQKMMQNSEWCDYRTEEEHERLKNARKQIRKLGRLEMVISTYSNTLLSVSMINMTHWRVSVQPRSAPT